MILKGRLMALVAMREAIAGIAGDTEKLGLSAAGRAEYAATVTDFSRELAREVGNAAAALTAKGGDAKAVIEAAGRVHGAPAPAHDPRVVELLAEIRDGLVALKEARAVVAGAASATPQRDRLKPIELRGGVGQLSLDKRLPSGAAAKPVSARVGADDLLPADAYGACAFRKALGIRLEDIGQLMGRDQSSVSTMENMIRRGKHPTAEVLARYRKAIVKLADRDALSALARNLDEVVSTWGPLDGVGARRRFGAQTTGKEATR